MNIRPYEKDDTDSIVALNAESEAVLSPMDTQGLLGMRALASVLWVAEQDDQVVGFLIAFTDGEDYENVNYQWFANRLKKFVYVDRIVVAPQARSQGMGKAFYHKLEEWGVDHGLCWMAAEIDIEPANDGSLRFHEREGFVQVGRQTLSSGKDVVFEIKNLST